MQKSQGGVKDRSQGYEYTTTHRRVAPSPSVPCLPIGVGYKVWPWVLPKQRIDEIQSAAIGREKLLEGNSKKILRILHKHLVCLLGLEHVRSGEEILWMKKYQGF